MSLDLQLSLDRLVDTYTRAIHAPGAHPSPEHAGLSAVLRVLSDTARHACAQDYERYDHRSLYEFAAALDYATKPPRPAP